MNKLIEKCRTQTTEMLLVSLSLLATNRNPNEAERMAQAAIVEVYCERNGVQASNELMDSLGM